MRDAQHVYPGDYWLNFELGALLHERQDYEGAVRFFTAAVAIRPNSAAAHNNLGVGLKQQKKQIEAIASYRKAIELDPKLSQAHSNLGSTLAKQKKWDEAIAAHREAIRLKPDDASPHYNLSFALKAKGRWNDAIAALREAIRLEPDFYSAHGHLGDALYDQGDWPGAFSEFEETIRLKPDHQAWNPKLAVLLATCPDAKLRDPQRALKVATKFAELAPRDQDARAWQVLGWVRYWAGDWNGSIEALENSCKLQEGGIGDAAQWIVLALAHAKLAAQEGLPERVREHHMSESRREYERGIKQIDSWWRVRPPGYWFQAIWDFSVEARKLIGAEVEQK